MKQYLLFYEVSCYDGWSPVAVTIFAESDPQAIEFAETVLSHMRNARNARFVNSYLFNLIEKKILPHDFCCF